MTYKTCREYQNCKQIKQFVRTLVKASGTKGVSVAEVEDALRKIDVPEQLMESEAKPNVMERVIPKVAASALASMSQFIVFSRAEERWYYKHADFDLSLKEKAAKYLAEPKRQTVIYGIGIDREAHRLLRERIVKSKKFTTKSLVSYAKRIGVLSILWVWLGEKRMIANLLVYRLLAKAVESNLIESDGFGKWKRKS
jgi:hypothetical protein